MVALSARVLLTVSRNWADPKPLAGVWWEQGSVQALEAEASSLIQAQFGAGDAAAIDEAPLASSPLENAVFKDSWVSILAPF